MRKAFTLVELIFVLVVMAILSGGTFKAIEAIYIRSAQAKALTDLSLQSQIVLDQLSVLLYNRIPNSVIGYTPGGICEPLSELTDPRPVLEWLGTADDELLRGEYDGFVDMNASWPNPKLVVPGNILSDSTNYNLIFAGAFDGGSEDIRACSGAFGWHGAESDLSFGFNYLGNNITIADLDKQPNFIYEKYYLTKTAYSVARGENININASCITDLNVSVNENTLFLFYEYHPYNDKTFCADSAGSPEGEVTILAQDVTAFSAQEVNGVIRLGVDMDKTIRGRTCGVHVSKQKAVF